MNAAAVAAAKAAVREAKKLLARTMYTAEWKLCGRIEADTVEQEGMWLVSTPPEDPLRLEHVPTGRALVVPFSSMETDFASVPRAAQGIGGKALHLKPRDYERSAYLHDQLYAAGWCWAVRKGEDARAVKVPVSKAAADAMLFCALECEGATLADGLAYHGGVALFGGPAWRRCRREKAEWPEMFETAKDAKGAGKTEERRTR